MKEIKNCADFVDIFKDLYENFSAKEIAHLFEGDISGGTIMQWINGAASAPNLSTLLKLGLFKVYFDEKNFVKLPSVQEKLDSLSKYKENN